jgi:hypothetical protein
LRRDPAVRTAAVAITHGLDPLRFLALGEDDYDIAVAALQEAEVLRHQRDTTLLKAAAESIAARTISRLVKAFRT